MSISTASLNPMNDRPRSGKPATLVPAVKRALTVLDKLASTQAPMTLARLSSDLGLPKSSVHGLCSTLMSFGYLRRESDGTYLIGPAVMRLAEAFAHSTDVTREFSALWQNIGATPDETVVLSVLSGTDSLYLAVRNNARPLGVAYHVGMRLPAYLSASGKAMLAMCPPESVRELLAAGLTAKLTHKAPISVDALLEELLLTRLRGYSIDEEGVREGVLAFGAPVFDATGEAIAAVSVSFIKSRIGADDGERHRDLALRVAGALSNRLGGQAPVIPMAPMVRSSQVKKAS